VTLSPGANRVVLEYSGNRIARWQRDGPYTVYSILVRDVSGHRYGRLDVRYHTQAYRAAEFED
jgi:hypothetical protein